MVARPAAGDATSGRRRLATRPTTRAGSCGRWGPEGPTRRPEARRHAGFPAIRVPAETYVDTTPLVRALSRAARCQVRAEHAEPCSWEDRRAARNEHGRAIRLRSRHTVPHRTDLQESAVLVPGEMRRGADLRGGEVPGEIGREVPGRCSVARTCAGARRSDARMRDHRRRPGRDRQPPWRRGVRRAPPNGRRGRGERRGAAGLACRAWMALLMLRPSPGRAALPW